MLLLTKYFRKPMDNIRFNAGFSSTYAWDILPDLGNVAGRRSSTRQDNSVRRHFIQRWTIAE